MVRHIFLIGLLTLASSACKKSEAGGNALDVGATASAGAGSTAARQRSDTQPVEAQGDKSQMIQGKPVFDVRIDMENCPHDVYVNGGLVERNLMPAPAHAEYQVNHYLRSGRNDIEVFLGKADGETNECDARVQLRYLDASAPEDAQPITLLTLVHEAATAPAADLARGSSPAGSYDSRTGAPRDDGDVRVGPASVVSANDYIQILSRTIELSLPFPEWAFLRSEPMTIDWKITDESEKTRAYEQLLARYNELHALLQKEDVDAFLDACEERSRELDLAYYKAPGATRRALEQNLRQAMADPTLELADLYKAPGKRWGYMVGSKGTLVALTQGKRASPIFRYQMKDDTPFSMVFPVLFRKEKGKLIVAR